LELCSFQSIYLFFVFRLFRQAKDKTAPFQGLDFVLQNYRLTDKKATSLSSFFDKFSTFANNRACSVARGTFAMQLFLQVAIFAPNAGRAT
jgi:hypothetical protein